MFRSLYALRRAWGYAALGLLLSLIACGSPSPTPTPAPLLRVAATDLTAPRLAEWSAAYAANAPEVRFEISSGSPARVIEKLRAGQIDLAVLAAYPADVFATPVSVITFTLIVHPDNPLTGLTPEQTHAAFTGGVTDWAQLGRTLGGALQVVSAADDSDAGRAWAAVALAGARPTRTALLAPTWPAMREWVSTDINALGYLPLAEVDATVKPLAVSAEWSVPMVAVALSEPSGPARAFLAWIQQ